MYSLLRIALFTLFQIIHHALPAKGTLVVIETMIDNERKQNLLGLLMSLTMLLDTGEGYDYSFQELEQWTKEVGFSHIEFLPLTSTSTAAIAYK